MFRPRNIKEADEAVAKARNEGWRPRGPMSPDDRLKQMTKDFNLTADQQTKIKPILVDSQKKMEDLRNDSQWRPPGHAFEMMEFTSIPTLKLLTSLTTSKNQFDKQTRE